jgi:hypothetical protein
MADGLLELRRLQLEDAQRNVAEEKSAASNLADDLASNRGRLQDGTFSQACPDGRAHGGISSALAAFEPVPDGK